MDEHLAPTENAYAATVIISPMMDGQEQKDQDRARFFEPGQSACLCDGVTASHNSARAAEMVTSFAPALFQGDIAQRLQVLCDLLMLHRRECVGSSDISMPRDMPEAMRQMLQRVVQSKKAESFQTTIVAAQFSVRGSVVSIRMVKCGDSALLAFSPDGELLTSTLARSPCQIPDQADRLFHGHSQKDTAMHFGPGDEILVRIDGPLSRDGALAQAAGIRPEHLHNWIVCTPIDSCCRQTDSQNSSQARGGTLGGRDRLIVPKYLYGQLLTSTGQQYLVLRYSSCIRIISHGRSSIAHAGFETGSSSTLVLPDHFYAGAYECLEDTFPLGTHFLLCSDGFYGAFSDWPDMCQWLQAHAAVLRREDQRTGPLDELHARLRNSKGDDDISLIWVQPRNPKTSTGEPDDVC